MGNSGLDRRRFLLTSSAGVLSATLASPSWAATWWTGLTAHRLGYLPEATGQQALREFPETLVAADGLPSGDSSLSRTGARLTVHGLSGDVEALAAAGVHDAAFTVRFPGGRDFVAWAYGTDPVHGCGGGCEFDVPLDDDGLELTIELGFESFLGGSRAEPVGVAHRLVTGSDRGVAKLRSGTYVIPLQSPSGDAESGLVLSVRPAIAVDRG